MRVRPLLVFSIVVCGCFGESPDGEDPTGDDTTSATDPSMTSTSTASTTTVDPVTTSPTSDVTGTADPTTAESTATTDDTMTTDPDSSSTGEPAENVFQDFYLDAGNASWSNDLGAVLSFPVYPNDAAADEGHAFLVSMEHKVVVESTAESFEDDAMVLHPRYATDGEVRGRYDGLVYEDGDRFRTHAYCVQSVTCAVELVLAHSIEQSVPTEITSFEITADDLDGVEIDFELAGGGFTPGVVTELSLIVRAGKDSASDSVLLDRPRIVRP